MGSEEPGTPPRSPAIGTGSEEPGASRAPFKTSIDGFLNLNFTSTEQECGFLHQPDVGVDGEKETTATSQQAAVREEFAGLTDKRQQQRGTTAWATEQKKQFDRGRSYEHHFFSGKENVCLPCVPFCLFFPCVLSALYCVIFPSCPQNCRSRYERRYELFGCTRCVYYCTRRGASTISVFRR